MVYGTIYNEPSRNFWGKHTLERTNGQNTYPETPGKSVLNVIIGLGKLFKLTKMGHVGMDFKKSRLR